jgi:hypothetical protein
LSNPPKPPPDLNEFLADFAVKAMQTQDDDRRATTILALAVITLLIDAKVTTIEGAISRIEHIQSTFSDKFKTEAVSSKLAPVLIWLRGHLADKTSAWKPQVIEGGRKDDPASDD